MNTQKKLSLAAAKELLHSDAVFETATAFKFCDYGKYAPDLTFVIPKTFEVDDNGNAINPIHYVRDHETTANINIDFDGMAEVMTGDFWLSANGKPHFRLKAPSDAQHLLIRVDWGGCYNYSRGTLKSEAEEIPGILYFHRAASNGGGVGYDYWVVPMGFACACYDPEIDGPTIPEPDPAEAEARAASVRARLTKLAES